MEINLQTEEIWMDIKDYEGYYQISNFGRVKSLARSVPGRYNDNNYTRILKPGICRGYPRVILSKNKIKKTFSLHRLVACHFIPNPKGYKEVNHIDGNKCNNNISNLEWCDSSYNNLHKFRVLGYTYSKETLEKFSKTHKGFKWSEENKKYLSERLKGTKKPGLNKKVQCITTGEIFESVQAAADAKNTSASNISCCLSGKTKRAVKLEWRFI